MTRMPYLMLGIGLLAQALVNCRGQEIEEDRLALSPADFTQLDGARIVEVEGTATGKAVAFGKRWVTECLRAAYPLGHGHGPVSALFRLRG